MSYISVMPKAEVAARLKAYYEANKETIAIRKAARYQENREQKLADGKVYRETHKEEIAAKKKADWTARNAERVAESRAKREAERETREQAQHERKIARRKIYNETHKEERLAYSNEYEKTHRVQRTIKMKHRRNTDVNFRTAGSLRNRFNGVRAGRIKSGSAVLDLGISVSEFNNMIEQMWWPGMNWENYGRRRGKWNFDHIRPLSSFDLTDREQFLEAAHFTNYQPLWHEDNIKKGDRLDWSPDESLKEAPLWILDLYCVGKWRKIA